MEGLKWRSRCFYCGLSDEFDYISASEGFKLDEDIFKTMDEDGDDKDDTKR